MAYRLAKYREHDSVVETHGWKAYKASKPLGLVCAHVCTFLAC